MSFCLTDTISGTALNTLCLAVESQDCQVPGPENEGGSVMLAAHCQRSPWLAQLAVRPLCTVSTLKTLVAQGTRNNSGKLGCLSLQQR